MAKVTIIVPIYNNAAYLPRCFGSIQAQTEPDWEAILVDDGSPDESGAICDEWAAKDPRFRVIHKPNGGVCTARNAGLDGASAPYAMLLDQDDLLSPCAAEVLLRTQAANPGAFALALHTEDRAELAEHTTGTEAVTCYTARQAGYLYNEAPFPPPWDKLLDLGLMRRHGVRFREDIRDGYEDRPFMRDYLAALWGEDPQAVCAVVQTPLYFWERENEASVSSSGRQPLKPWHLEMFDGFLTDCLEVYKVPPVSLQFYMMQYVQTLAFSMSCLPPEGRRQAAAWIYDDPALARLLEYFRKYRIYTVFYEPLRKKDTEKVVRLSKGRLDNDSFYWRRYKLGRLLHPGWRDWQGIEAIPRE